MAKSLAELRRMPRHQLNKVNRYKITESFLSAPEEDSITATVTEKLSYVMEELTKLKKALIAPDSIISKKFAELQS
ncbi:hypothetical protein E2C01_022727 [Portunus trituberculatus]|uniref:Uncharacterized protein n=1 Tax=Portunus trituberculatus TaxID=210409 RepID=A0A5B7E642_PORTR|nr:hypothetical protein [Portunus trituberculatus]